MFLEIAVQIENKCLETRCVLQQCENNFKNRNWTSSR